MLSPDYVRIRSLLEDRGYTTKGFERTPSLILGEMGLIRVYSNVDRRSLGVTGPTSPKELTKAYSDLIQMNYKDLDVDPNNILFHEFGGDYSAKTGRNPREVLQKLGNKIDLVSKINRKLKLDLTTISIGLGLKEEMPSSSKWGHITIRPSYGSSNSTYHLSVVYRNNLEEVLDFAKKIESKMSDILEVFEGH